MVTSNTSKMTQAPPRNAICNTPIDGQMHLRWKMRTNNLAIQEIISDRRAAIESGRLKGRRLFHALEGGGELGSSQENERCSACSSVLIHESEVRSLCYYSSSPDFDEEDEAENGDNLHGSCACVENVKKEKVVGRKGGIGIGGGVHGSWCMGSIAWIVFSLVVFAFVIIYGQSFHGRDDGEGLIPT